MQRLSQGSNKVRGLSSFISLRDRNTSTNPARPTVTQPHVHLIIMEDSEASSGPTVAAEVEMAKEMKQKDFGRALEIFSAAATKNVNAASASLCTVGPVRELSISILTLPHQQVRMVNMAFSAEAETGRSVDAAAVEALRRCGEYKIEATVALHNNVLATLAKRSPPEATLSWLARMRASRIPLDVVACNIQRAVV